MLTEVRAKLPTFARNALLGKKFTSVNGLLTDVNPSRGDVSNPSAGAAGTVPAFALLALRTAMWKRRPVSKIERVVRLCRMWLWLGS
jgi:hypothetical protein